MFCRLGSWRHKKNCIAITDFVRCVIPPEIPNHGLDRVRHQLRVSGFKDATTSALRSGVHTRGYLPHVKHEGAEYFVTFRLEDSLPKEVLLRYKSERAERIRRIQDSIRVGQKPSEDEETINRDFFRKVERHLDQGAGACYLRVPEIAELTVGALKFFHEERYLLHEWVVMPNHVHAMFWPMPNYFVSEILKSWKQFTSRRAKRILNLSTERFWQPESHDHWIRNDEERARIAKYIRNNPVAAGLCARAEDWRWSSAWQPAR